MSGNIDYNSLYDRLELWGKVNQLCKACGYKSLSLSKLASHANISRQTLYCIINGDETGFGVAAAEKLESAITQIIVKIISASAVRT